MTTTSTSFTAKRIAVISPMFLICSYAAPLVKRPLKRWLNSSGQKLLGLLPQKRWGNLFLSRVIVRQSINSLHKGVAYEALGYGGTEDLPEKHLYRGQVGTVVEELAKDVYEVEFSDDEGRTYALLPLREAQLITLHYEFVA